jgi:hypothetical protein
MTWSTRIWLGLVGLFWLAMSALLWRSEFGPRRQIGSSIPPAVVWQKILTAPDSSRLEIRYGTNHLGYCLWRADIGQEIATGLRMVEDEPVEGMVQRLAYYTLDLEGNAALTDFPTRMRFSASLKLDTNYAWQTFEIRVTMRPDSYELLADAAEQTVHFRVDAGADKFDRKFRLAELQNPQRLLQELGGPMLPMMAAAIGVPLSTNRISASLGLRWEARNDSILVGRTRLRAYRLQTRLVDRYRLILFVSPVGEILRAELPGNIVLLNDQLSGLRNISGHD